MLGARGLHPGFQGERGREQKWGDAAGNAAPRAGGTIAGEPGLGKKGPWLGKGRGRGGRTAPVRTKGFGHHPGGCAGCACAEQTAFLG